MDTTAVIAPRSRMWRVSRRVSTPWIATVPVRSRKVASDSSARQFEVTGDSSRTTSPLAHTPRLSMSCALMPQLPMWGIVIVMICPRYDGSVSTSW